MALVTRCPHCHTAFKVVADQLRVRNGLVRCGACGTIFDGRACLEGEGGIAPSAAASPGPFQPSAARGDGQGLPSSAYLAGSQASSLAGYGASPNLPPELHAPAPRVPAPHVSEPLHAPESPRVPEPPAVLRGRHNRQDAVPRDEAVFDAAGNDTFGALDDEPDEEPSREAAPETFPEPLRAADPANADDGEPFSIGGEPDQADTPVGAPVYGEARTRYASATDVGRAPPAFLDQDRIQAQRRRRRVWGWLCLIGLLALALQGIYIYRTPIANAAPSLRPALTAACQALGCRVGYARRIERIFIVSSALRPPQGGAQADDDGRTRLVLTAVLRNRYDKDQEWPALSLELTDLSDTVVARKLIPPAAYLSADAAAGPMRAGAEVSLTVPIEVEGLQVNGYQLDKFFP